MEVWDQLQRSFFISLIIIIAACATQFQPTLGSSMCSNFFRFDQLCPDPRVGVPGIYPKRETTIHLDTVNSRSISKHPYSTHSSTSVKDPSTTSCDFHRNGVENTVVTAIHSTENPWNFRHANACTHIVKISHELYDSDESQNSRRSGSSTYRNGVVSPIKKEKVCERDIGIQRYRSNHGLDVQSHELDNEEVISKVSVYFWHNFTLFPHSVSYVDTIKNYHMGKDDIACSYNPQYVQIAVSISRNGSCEIVVQQYKIDKNRSRVGCTGSEYPIPYPVQFCGAYECSQSNNILTNLKLLFRRGSEGYSASYHSESGKEASGSTRNSHRHGGLLHFPSHGKQQQQQHHDDSLKYVDEDRSKTTTPGFNVDGQLGDKQLPPCDPSKEATPASTVVTFSPNDENGENDREDKPRDWKEYTFLCVFPVCGILFILLVLNILHSRNAREICRGYPYPLGHCALEGSYEKSTLPM